MWPGDVVLPSQLAGEVPEGAVVHDEMECALLGYTHGEGVSPGRYYPFNEETEALYQDWQRRRQSSPGHRQPASPERAREAPSERTPNTDHRRRCLDMGRSERYADG